MWIFQTTERSEDGPFMFRMMPGSIKTIGRAATADFVLDAGMVSRFHCRITANASGQVDIEDLESTNGTFVNDRRIRRRPLEAGDRVRIGRVEMVFSAAQ